LANIYTMETTEKAVNVLNDLIEINNDRIAGFEKALADIDDANADLKVLFQEYATQSRENSQELTALAATYTSDIETGTSVSGGLHRAWIDVKSIFGASDRESILNEAERGEDAIKAAYTKALTDGELPATALETVNKQAAGIKSAHDKIKALRDLA
jgi:uncharacterized protein (TIGR02284 family)